MRNATLLMLLLVSCASYTVPRSLRGSWVNPERSFRFTRDSVYIQESRLAQVGCFVEKHAPVSRLSLIVVNDGVDYDLVVAVPYAILNVQKDTLRVQQVNITGISVRDLQYFPWPTEFGGDSLWIFKRSEK